MNTRPVSITHLVMGIVFTGIAAIWLVGEVTDADTPSFGVWGPALLIAAGAIGLVASVANARRREVPLDPTPTDAPTTPPDAESGTTDHHDVGTGVVHEEDTR